MAFQNCNLRSSVFGQFSSNKIVDTYSSSGTGGGNGGGYDGNQVLNRLVPGFNCSSQRAPYASLQIGATSAVLTSNCNQTQTLALSEIEFAKYSNDYAGYKDGLYSLSSNLASDLATGSFTEAWCQATPGTHSPEAMNFEVAIHWQQDGDQAQSRYYTSKSLAPVEASVQRVWSIDQVSYVDGSSQLSIHFLNHIPGSVKFPGVYSQVIEGVMTQTPVACRLGGQFDTVAPQFSYPENFATLSVGSIVNNMSPSINKSSAVFSITPNLPSGLNFNSSTGEITGSPNGVQARQNYLVTADFEFGEITRALSIGVGQVLALDVNCQSTTCSLSDIINQANSLAPIPAVVILSNPNIAWPGTELSITGDVEIRGQGTVIFDAQSKSRHFTVQPGAILSLQNLSLKNGQGALGGSIQVGNGATLNVNNIVFDSNVASAVSDQSDEVCTPGPCLMGQGGAIYVSEANLSVSNSQFLNNSTASSIGSDLAGGAIYADTSLNLSVSNSQFSANQSVQGGAIYIQNSSLNSVALISECSFNANQAFQGAGIYAESGNTMINQSTFTNNSATFEGGALNAFWTNQTEIQGSQFIANSAANGSALAYQYLDSWSQFYIYNSRFNQNVLSAVTQEASPNSQGSILYLFGPVSLGNSIFTNTSTSTSDCQWIFPSALNNFVTSLGGNQFDDSSCNPKNQN